MSLQFIFGNSGAGKSYTLFRSVIEDSIRHPDQSYLVIVPEQFTMQTQKGAGAATSGRRYPEY